MSELDFEWQPVNPTGTNDFASQFAADAWKPPEHLLSIKWGADFRASAAQLAAADSASDATSVAVAAPDVVTPTDSAAPTDSVAPPTPTISNPNDFFICQFRDARFNPGGPPSSEDCGPTSLAMIARYYGATDDPAKLVSDVRFAMTGGRNSNEGTTLGEVKRGAEKLGLATEPVSDMQSLNSSLDAGHMVVLAGNPRDYEKQLGLHYGKGGTIYDGGHFITVVSHDGDSYVVNDPANHRGSMTLTREQVEKYISYDRGQVGIAVFSN